ncbi:MAG: hypothetical protein J0L92_14825, partial [Deltaproteobacteria bacterium]|nr:hypothetical protein [Deltaproteobacteria bacterium]
MTLAPCSGCARHVRASETACPFCGAPRAGSSALDASSADAGPPRASRQSVMFGAAVGAIAVSSLLFGGGCVFAYGAPAPADDTAAVTAQLQQVVEEMERRDRAHISRPVLAVAVDELADLLQT